MKRTIYAACMAMMSCMLLLSGNPLAQGISGAVTYSPTNATGDDSITITYDPRLDCEFGTWQSLVGETDIRMHSGVAYNYSYWNNVVQYFQTGQNGQSTQLTMNPDSTWSITLVPRDFYGVNPSYPIEAINCVFNNNSWNKEGKDYDFPGHCIDFVLPLQTFPTWNSVWHKTYNQHDATNRWVFQMSMNSPDCAWGAARVQTGTHYPGFVRVMNDGQFRRSDFLYNYPGYRPVMIASAGADSAWLLAMNSGAQQIKVFNTTDGGWVWNVQADSLFDMGQGSYPNVIHFWNKTEGIIMGDPVNGSWEIFRTTDAGTTWTSLDTSNIPAPLASEVGVEMAYAVVGDTIFFSTSGGRMFRSTDRGLHWSAISCPTTTRFAFASASEGWLLQSGTSNLFHTTDGGINWIQINYTGTIGGFNIKHVPGTASTLVSSNGGSQGVYYSLDGGQNWLPANGPEFERVYGIGIYDLNHGWAGGYSDSVQNLPMFRLVTALTPVVGNVYYSKPLPCQGEYITAWPDILVPVNQWEWILPWSTQPHLSDMFPSFTSASTGPKDVQLRVHNTFGVYDFYFSRAITFRAKPDFSLGTDTSLCIGQCIDLLPEIQKDLFFSEYIEGSGYNRALEIYNGTGQTVDMHDYAIWKNFNGSNWDGVYQFPLGTTLAQGDVLVIAHAQADTAILAQADIVLANADYSFMMGYTGDDVRALVIFHNGDTTILDYIGSETLEDPGMSWRVGDDWEGTFNHSLVRKSFIDRGQVYWNIAAGVDNNTSEWEVFGLDDFSHLGWHQTTDPYTYEWKQTDIGSILDSAAVLHFCQPNQHPSNLSLKLTDTWNCYRTDDISITPSIFYVDIAGESSICSGSCTQLTATAGTSYQWNTGDTTQSITACPQYGESYYVTVTDANGCFGIASHYVGTYNIIPVIQTTKDTLCGNESAILSAPGYVSYQWSTGDTTPTAEAWHPGNYNLYYYLTVTDTSGCSGTAGISIWHLEKPSVVITGDTQLTQGECTLLHASGGQRYLWNTGISSPGINVCPQATTTYSVQSWFLYGGLYSTCRDTAWVTVEVLEPPVISLSPDTQVCAGGCATLTASGNGTLLWSTGSTSSQISVCPMYTQTYTVTLTSSGGQTVSGSITVTVIPDPQVAIMGVPGLCEGECTTLTAIGNGTFLWSTGDTATEISVCPVQPQFYGLTLTDPNGCTNSDTFFLTVWPSPVIQISGNTQINQGQCASLTASGGATYAWNTGDGSATVQLCPAADSTYTVTVYSAEGCESTDTIMVTVNPQVQGYGLKAYLSGAYLGAGLMRTNRSALSSFPLTQPYSGPPWNYTGNEYINAVHADMVDWVLVEYRAAADCTLIAGREAKLLWKDGTVTEPQGNSLLQSTVPGNNYIVLYHLNHLPVMTAHPVSLTSGATYDLSDTLACPLYGGGRRAAYQLGSGLAGLPVGDLNHDKRLKYSGPQNDRNIILTRINTQTGSTAITTTTGGYFDEDLSMDGVVRYSGPGNDPSKIISNLIGLTGSTAITSIYVSPVPDGILGFACGQNFLDHRDGQVYPSVTIGNQCWMAKNLNIGVMVNSISSGTSHSDQSNNGIIEKYCYNNDPAYCDTFGGLYDWNEMMGYDTTEGIQGICPQGWHLPTDSEWCTMETFLDPATTCLPYGATSQIAGGMLKENGLSYWNTPNAGATNSSGFSARGAGYRYDSGWPTRLKSNADFWTSSTLYANNLMIARELTSSTWYVVRRSFYQTYGLSVRCVQDEPPCSPQPDQANAGPDSLNIPGDSIVLYANVPAVGSGQWSVTSGIGGVFSDPASPFSTFIGMPDSTYTLVWTLSTLCGSTSDSIVIGFAPAPPVFSACGDIFTDQRDGQQYATVLIGDNCWFAENLNYGTRVDAAVAMTDNGLGEKHCYNNDPAWCDTLGALYQWDEVMNYSLQAGAQGLCPDGWHVSSNDEWKNLEGSVDSQFGIGDTTWDIEAWRGFDAGKNLKSTSRWNSGGNGTDMYGFTAYPAGRSVGGMYNSLGTMTYFWVSQEVDSAMAWSRYLRADYDNIRMGYFYKEDGRSVRCVKDQPPCTPQPDQANAGPDSLNIPGDSIVLYANVPAVGTGLWWVDSLSAGSFSDATLPNSVFFGQAGQTYQLVWAISTGCATSTDTVVISFAPSATSNCSGSFTDSRDGQSYPMVHIGNQCWMGRNLNTGQFTQSVASGWTSHSDMSNDGVIQKYCYVNDQIYCDIYGGLYEWNEMMGYLTTEGIQGICPDGWHLPSDTEWTVLTDYLGGLSLAGGHLKDASPNFWSYPNTDATNGSGFTALPGGRRYFSGSFSDLSDYGLFWSSTPSASAPQYATIRSLGYQGGNINQYEGYKTYGLSVRCISDADPGPQPPVQANAGADSLGIGDNYIVLYGNYPMNGTGLWTIVSGQGGSFADSSLFNTEFYGNVGETYTLVWTINTSSGSSSDTVMIGFALVYPDCGMIYDFRDGRMYETVVIGSYCWMKENLNVGVRLDHTASATNDSIPEKYCYQDLEANCDIYGGLYSWNELTNYIGYNSPHGLCPEGWHVPEISEWQNLITAVANDGNALKEIGVGIPPLGEGTNLSGFSALLAGSLTGPGGNYEGLNQVGRFYTRSNPSSWPANYWVLHDSAAINGGSSSPGHAYSVRCVLDY